MVDFAAFRIKIKRYLRQHHRKQDDLAQVMFMVREHFNKVLNADKAPSDDFVRRVIMGLATLKCIENKEQARELLDLMKIPDFSAIEWKSEPLSSLADSASKGLPVPSDISSAFPKKTPEVAENATRFTGSIIEQGSFQREGPSSASPPPGTTHFSYEGHTHWALALSWEPNGTRIVSAGSDSTVQVWSAHTGHHLLTYRKHAYTDFRSKTKLTPSVYAVAWSPKEARIASSGTGKQVHIWQANTGKTLDIYKNHSGFFSYVFALAWSPDGMRLASACSTAGIDRTIHVWDVRNGQTVLRCDPHLGLGINFTVLALAWSPDGTCLAATCGDSKLHLWNATTGEHLVAYRVPLDASDIVWSPDSKRLATAHSDGTAHIWNAATGELLLTYSGHSQGVRSIAWSPDGETIASASNDHTVHLWHAITGQHLLTYTDHTDWVTSVAWSPDGTRIASASNDGSVKIWQAK